jgi:hypothetical protein
MDTGFWMASLNEGGRLEDIGIVLRIILKFIFDGLL